MTAFCPVCGHELTDAVIPKEIQKLNEELYKIEADIPKESRGWKSWGFIKKMGWINDDIDIAHARERRIQNIKNFQKSMPPRIVSFDSETLKKWDELLKKFDDALAEAQSELLQIKEEIYKDGENNL